MDDYITLLTATLAHYAPEVPRETYAPLLQMMKVHELKRGDIPVHIGDTPKELYFIASGLLRSYYIDLNGNDVTRFFLAEHTFCCSEVLLGKPLNCCFEALEECVLLGFPADAVNALVHQDKACMNAYIRALESSLQYKIERESSFLLKSATERYIDFQHLYPKLEERVNQAHIASYLGITPVSLSRIRRTIKEEN
ncbi:Crp/Fnr family transcriptional regulator [Acetanaerobacterium elongatum]|uniref:cAMP-binding domain of CRP or a regulatory subunit of cAMP-dependent protein kinases n=1 Tax=Acetanaerobacterium elongatum TaxID=258515 RepID=A0A1H0FC50_9FIRM|nr:Crp/Fnr family transcriptional regulator [Acetanaerobacterium elongatum]SDN92224.1 cAMP-binding domain of CRP or a regulatory subunit of cAMP-dependent protein kinases [Acetanaerobacterium elongatum]